MRLIELTVNNFKNFKGQHTIKLSKLNLFQGDNGSGKSSLILDAVLFALYGHAPQKISQLVTKGETSGYVQLYLEYNNKSYSIKREVPSKLTVLEESIPLSGTIKEKETKLEKIFHNLTWFKQFRLFDSVVGINLLEESNLVLRKTILAFNEDKLNKIRERLLAIKKERDKLNKDKANLYPHAPSEKRKSFLKQSLLTLKNNLTECIKKLGLSEYHLRTLSSKKGEINSRIQQLSYAIKRTDGLVICPTCEQQVTDSHKNKVKTLNNESIAEEKVKFQKVIAEIADKSMEIEAFKQDEEAYREKVAKLNRLYERLSARLLQKHYIWTDKDVEIAKKSLEELDSFYSFYVKESVKSLEPVINHILKPVNFILKFIINNKGVFDLVIYHNNQEFDYKELSTGQKLIISIAFKMALLLERGESGLIISDEGLSSLSEENLSKVVTLIQGFPFQLLAVVHRYENPLHCLKIYQVDKGTVKNV